MVDINKTTGLSTKESQELLKYIFSTLEDDYNPEEDKEIIKKKKLEKESKEYKKIGKKEKKMLKSHIEEINNIMKHKKSNY